MPRPLRVEFEGAIYHPTSRAAAAGQASCLRGGGRKPIFRDDANSRRFLDTLRESGAKTDWQESGEAKAGQWVRIARRLRAETTMTLAWIAQRLQMGVGTHGSNLLGLSEKGGERRGGKVVSIVRTDPNGVAIAEYSVDGGRDCTRLPADHARKPNDPEPPPAKPPAARSP